MKKPQQLRDRTVRHRSFENVTAGQTARLEITNGFLLHDIAIQYAGISVAQMTQIRIKANDETIYRAPGAFFDVMAFYDGYPDADSAGVLVIPFSRLGLKTASAEALTGMNIGAPDERGFVVARVVVEIDIAAAAPAPAMTAYSRVSDAVIGVGPGFVRRVIDFSKTGLVAGINSITNLTIPGQAVSTRLFLNRLYLNIPQANVREAILYRERREEERFTPALNEVYQKDKTPVADFVIIDPTRGGYGGNWFDLAVALEDFRLELDLQGALPAVMPYYAEFIGGVS